MYKSVEDVDESVGVWSYNDEKRELTLILKDEEEDETYFEIYELKIENDFLILFAEFGNGESGEIVFKKK